MRSPTVPRSESAYRHSARVARAPRLELQGHREWQKPIAESSVLLLIYLCADDWFRNQGEFPLWWSVVSDPRYGKRLMRTSALVLIASIAFPLMPAHATPLAYDFGGQNSHLYNRAQLTRFADDRGYHVVDLTRNHSPTYGDPLLKSVNGGPLFPITRMELPRFVDATAADSSWQARASIAPNVRAAQRLAFSFLVSTTSIS